MHKELIMKRIFSLLLLISALFPACKSSLEKPNIILLMADDLGWGDTGFNGNDRIKTPALDRLASEGIILTRFYSAAPVCSPTRASVLSGRHPYRTGIYGANSGHIRKNELLLPEILKMNAYNTGHFGKWHLGTLTNDLPDANRGGKGDTTIYSPPWENGFDVCFSTESKVPTWDPMITPQKEAGDIGNRLPGTHFGTYYWTGPGITETENLEGDDSRIIMDRAIPFIESSSSKAEPFFAVIWFHTPHLPVLTGKEFKDLYNNESNDIQNYYGSISAMDLQINRLITLLKDIDQYTNTIIIFASDNGPEGKSREGRTQGSTGGLKGRKRSLYEGGIRVPSFVSWPAGLENNIKLEVPISTSDYLPTIINLPGIKTQNMVTPIDGENILALLNGDKSERNTPIGFRSGNQRSFMDNEYKLYSSDNGKNYELYNIVNDPFEQKDISFVSSDIKAALIVKLEKWIESCDKSDSGHDY